MYAPALGQKEKRAPTWAGMRRAVEGGQLRESDFFQRRSEFIKEQRDSDSLGRDTGTRRRGSSITSINNGTLGDPLRKSSLGRVVGMYPVSASISATEHQNIVLRNTLGRICANLQLLIQTDANAAAGHRQPLLNSMNAPTTELTIVDIFVDEVRDLFAISPHLHAIPPHLPASRRISPHLAASRHFSPCLASTTFADRISIALSAGRAIASASTTSTVPCRPSSTRASRSRSRCALPRGGCAR